MKITKNISLVLLNVSNTGHESVESVLKEGRQTVMEKICDGICWDSR